MIALYDIATGLPADTTLKRYVAPEEARSLSSMGLKLMTYPDASLNQYVRLSIRNTAFAKVENNNEIVGISGGETSVYIRLNIQGETDVHDMSFPLVVTEIPEGTYFIRNKKLGNYLQIDDNVSASESNAIMELWEFDGKDYQKWVFTHLGDGYYSIVSAESALALSVQADYVGTGGTSIVQQAYTGDSRQRWIIGISESGSYILRPQSGESYAQDWCLSAGTGIGNDGRNVEQREYLENNDYKDEWVLATYTLSLNLYYDNAYAARHPNADTLINYFSPEMKELFSSVFNLTIYFESPQMITSTPDNCKLYRGLTIASSTINAICPANPNCKDPSCSYYAVNIHNSIDCENCTSWNQIYRDFIRQYPGNNLTTSVLFTGSALYDDSGDICNRSYRWYDHGILLQNIASSSEDYYHDVFSTFAHELSHEIGASDHYHEELKDADGKTYCRGGKLCLKCNPETGRPNWCFMAYGKIDNPDDYNEKALYCPECIEDILRHLADHHI